MRRICRILGFRRQTYYQRRQGYRAENTTQELAKCLHQAAEEFVSWGFWKIFHYLRNSGLQDNHKRVYRVWKKEGLHLRRPPKRERIYRQYKALLSPEKINYGWAMDFVSDWLVGSQGKRVRIINVIDEASRKALWTEAHQSVSATKLKELLDYIIQYRGKPAYIRCDNGPEFIADELKNWAEKRQIELRFIQPGKPSQNGLIERLNKTLRTECLNLNWFGSIAELNEELQEWAYHYNTFRPHESLKNKAPDDYEWLNQDLYYSLVAA
jgi:putative transposase